MLCTRLSSRANVVCETTYQVNSNYLGGRMKIIADTPTLYSPREGEKCGIKIIPACTIINNKVYKDFEDISSEEFLEKVKNGALATTSQPVICEIIDVFEESKEELLVLPIGDGLSGTYQNALGAKNCIEDNEHIHVINTKTLAGAQHYLVQKAKRLQDRGMELDGIIKELKQSIESSISFVIPEDYDFLKRSGRLTPVAAKIASVIKIVPVLTQTEDKKKITLFKIMRSKKKALDVILERLREVGVNEDYYITVSHAGIEKEAKKILEKIKEQFESTKTELFELSPALISHGGPGCIVIQAIHK